MTSKSIATVNNAVCMSCYYYDHSADERACIRPSLAITDDEIYCMDYDYSDPGNEAEGYKESE